MRELSGQSLEGLGWATGLPVEYVEAVEAGLVELSVRGLADMQRHLINSVALALSKRARFRQRHERGQAIRRPLRRGQLVLSVSNRAA